MPVNPPKKNPAVQWGNPAPRSTRRPAFSVLLPAEMIMRRIGGCLRDLPEHPDLSGVNDRCRALPHRKNRNENRKRVYCKGS